MKGKDFVHRLFDIEGIPWRVWVWVLIAFLFGWAIAH